jgi:hypothetical protein
MNRLIRTVFSAVGPSAAGPGAPAVPARQDPNALRAVAEQFLQTQAAGLPGEVSVKVGAVDPRTALAGCPAPEAFLQPGARAWGKTTVGRALHGAIELDHLSAGAGEREGGVRGGGGAAGPGPGGRARPADVGKRRHRGDAQRDHHRHGAGDRPHADRLAGGRHAAAPGYAAQQAGGAAEPGGAPGVERRTVFRCRPRAARSAPPAKARWCRCAPRPARWSAARRRPAAWSRWPSEADWD